MNLNWLHCPYDSFIRVVQGQGLDLVATLVQNPDQNQGAEVIQGHILIQEAGQGHTKEQEEEEGLTPNLIQGQDQGHTKEGKDHIQGHIQGQGQGHIEEEKGHILDPILGQDQGHLIIAEDLVVEDTVIVVVTMAEGENTSFFDDDFLLIWLYLEVAIRCIMKAKLMPTSSLKMIFLLMISITTSISIKDSDTPNRFSNILYNAAEWNQALMKIYIKPNVNLKILVDI